MRLNSNSLSVTLLHHVCSNLNKVANKYIEILAKLIQGKLINTHIRHAFVDFAFPPNTFPFLLLLLPLLAASPFLLLLPLFNSLPALLDVSLSSAELLCSVSEEDFSALLNKLDLLDLAVLVLVTEVGGLLDLVVRLVLGTVGGGTDGNSPIPLDGSLVGEAMT